MSVFISSPSSFICIIMFCRSLLLVLLGLVCLQSITTFLNANGLDRCCVSYQTHPIPVRCIIAYKVTDPHCSNPGVIFTVHHGDPVCANPTDRWVQMVIDEIDRHSFTSLVKPEVPPPSPIRNDPDKPVSTASSNIEPTSHPAQQDYMQETVFQPEPVSTPEPVSSASRDIESTSPPAQQDYTEESESDKTDSPAASIMVQMEQMCIASHT